MVHITGLLDIRIVTNSVHCETEAFKVLRLFKTETSRKTGYLFVCVCVCVCAQGRARVVYHEPMVRTYSTFLSPV